MLLGFFTVEATGERVDVSRRIVVGRQHDCDVPIQDSGASRQHVEIYPVRDDAGSVSDFHWRDLGSTNGTLVNGAKMREGRLSAGDRIQVGEAVLIFDTEEVAAPKESEESTALFQETVFNARGEVQPKQAPSKTAILLEAVYNVANEIATNFDPCALMDRVLETTLEAINAQRGAVFLSNEEHILLPCPQCGHIHAIQDKALKSVLPGDIPISHTIAERVLKHGESVLYQNDAAEGEVDASASIMALELRSIICAPLRAKHGIMGILYIDTNRSDQSYSQEDMLLAAAVGNTAGLALENAEMHQEMLEKQRIEQDIRTAWTIQEGFLVKEWPDAPTGHAVYGETRPAKVVGGDFYDYLLPREATVGILIGDVSGKGVPASLAMAQLLASFRLHAREYASPADVLQALNHDFYNHTQFGLFCTLCYATLDLKTGALTCANAGHNPMAIMQGGDTSSRVSASGPPVGILAEGPWQDEKIVLQPGDMVLLYTDGITEARWGQSPEGTWEQYELERVEGQLVRGNGKTPQEIIQAINEEVLAFCQPELPHDDCTMLGLRYTGL